VAKSVASGRKKGGLAQKVVCVWRKIWRGGLVRKRVQNRRANGANKKTRDRVLNQKRKIINLKFKINTKFQHLKIRAEFKIVKIIKILKITAQKKIIKILKF